jgi:hypothetical protein
VFKCGDGEMIEVYTEGLVSSEGIVALQSLSSFLFGNVITCPIQIPTTAIYHEVLLRADPILVPCP